jgi:hypothetical protein
LKSVLDKEGKTNISQNIIVLSKVSETSRIESLADVEKLLYRPEGFSSNQISQIESVARSLEYEIILAPDRHTSEDASWYQQLLTSPNLHETVFEMERKLNRRLSVITDDQSFVYDDIPRSAYLDRNFWRSLLSWNPRKRVKETTLLFSLLLLCLVVASALIPYFFTASIRKTKQIAPVFHCFFTLGFCFMSLESVFLQQLALLLGSPGYTLTIVLSTLCFSIGIGSYFFGDKAGYFIKNILFYVLTWLITWILFREPVLGWAVKQTFFVRNLICLFILSSIGIGIGALFPFAIRQVNRNINVIIPWAWAIKGLAGLAATLIAPLVVQSLGFRVLFFLILLFYSTLLLNSFLFKPLTGSE